MTWQHVSMASRDNGSRMFDRKLPGSCIGKSSTMHQNVQELMQSDILYSGTRAPTLNTLKHNICMQVSRLYTAEVSADFQHSPADCSAASNLVSCFHVPEVLIQAPPSWKVSCSDDFSSSHRLRVASALLCTAALHTTPVHSSASRIWCPIVSDGAHPSASCISA